MILGCAIRVCFFINKGFQKYEQIELYYDYYNKDILIFNKAQELASKLESRKCAFLAVSFSRA